MPAWYSALSFATVQDDPHVARIQNCWRRSSYRSSRARAITKRSVTRKEEAPEKACKPGSVSPTVSRRGDGHFSRALVARRLQRPDPGAARATPLLPYLVLLRVGFTWPVRSPAPLVSSYLTV